MSASFGTITTNHDVIYSRYSPEQFVGRDWLVRKVARFRDSLDGHHLIIVGEPGSGKSTFMAYLAATWNCPLHFIRVDNIAGVTGVDPRSFLISLGSQLFQKFGHDIFPQGTTGATKVVAGLTRDKAEIVGRFIDKLYTLPFLSPVERKVEVKVGLATGASKIIGERIRAMVDVTHALDEKTLLHVTVLDPLQMVKELYPEQRVVILIDALDESLQHPGNSILDVIPRATDLDFPDNLRLVMTTRPGDHLVSFREEDQLNLDDEEKGYKDLSLEDTGDYIKKRLAEEPLVSALATLPEEKAKALTDEIETKNDGNFLYLYHFFNALSESVSEGEIDFNLIPVLKDLDEIYRFFAVKRIRKTPYDLLYFTVTEPISKELQTYLRAIEGVDKLVVSDLEVTVMAKDSDLVLLALAQSPKIKISSLRTQRGTELGAWEEKYLPILGVLTVAFEALSRNQLASFAAVEVEYVDSILAHLLQFLDRIKRDSAFRYRIYHRDFAEYLLDSTRNRDYPLDASTYHQRIAFCFRHGADSWADVDWKSGDNEYPFPHLANHLIAAGEYEQLFELVSSGQAKLGWAEAHYAFSSSYVGYLTDLEKAWHLSESEEDWNLGRQMRYAFIESSIRSLEGNFLAKTLFELVAAKRISVAQALGSIQLITEGYPRAKALTTVAPLLQDASDQRFALQIAQRIVDEAGSRVQALIGLVEHLNDELKIEIFEMSKGIENEEERAQALIGIMEHLPQESKVGVTDALLHLDDAAIRARALAELLEKIPFTERDRVLKEARMAVDQIGDEIARADLLSKLIKHVPEEQVPQICQVILKATRISAEQENHDRILLQTVTNLSENLPYDSIVFELQQEALNVVGEKANSSSSSARDLGVIAFHLPLNLRDEALVIACSLDQNTWNRAEALSGLAELFVEQKSEILDEALKTAQGIENVWSRAFALCSVVDHLPNRLRIRPVRDALKAVSEEADESWRISAFKNVASRLPEELVEEALSVAQSFKDEKLRAEALDELVMHLPGAMKSKVLEDLISLAMHIGDKGTVAETITRLIPYLPLNLRDEAISLVFTICQQEQENDIQIWAQARALQALTTILTPDKVSDLLEPLRLVKSENARGMVLGELAKYLPVEVLVLSREIRDENVRAEILADLAPHLPDASLDTALVAACEIDNEVARISAVRGLLGRLPDERREELFYEFQELQINWQTAEAMTELANHLSGELRSQALQIALEAARGIEDDWTRVNTFAGMLGRYEYSEEEQTELVDEALRYARQIEEDWIRGRELIELAKNLTGEIKDKVTCLAMEAALEERDIYHRAEVLSILLDLLSEKMITDVMKQILKLLGNIGGDKDYEKARILSPMLDHIDTIPENLQIEILTAGLGFDDIYLRTNFLSKFERYLPEDLKAKAVEEVLESARSLEFAKPRVESLVNLSRVYISDAFTKEILCEAFVATRDIEFPGYVGNEQASCYQQIVSSWAKTNFFGLEDFRKTFQETLRSIGSHQRWQFLLELGALVELVNRLDGSSAISDTYLAIRDGSNWWP